MLYDLLSEDSGYKRILCNQSEKLVSVSLKRKTIRSMLRQISYSNLKTGYVEKVLKNSISDKINAYKNSGLDYVKERYIYLLDKWPSEKQKYLLVGSESSGTTAVSDLLFKEVEHLRYLEEGEQKWVWEAYRSVYGKQKSLKEYPRLQLFDAIKVPGFSVIIDEFLQSKTNHRTDKYGGSLENRYRFLKEIVEAVLRGLNLRNNAVNFEAIKKIDYRNRRKIEEKRFEELLKDSV